MKYYKRSERTNRYRGKVDNNRYICEYRFIVSLLKDQFYIFVSIHISIQFFLDDVNFRSRVLSRVNSVINLPNVHFSALSFLVFFLGRKNLEMHAHT